MGDVSLANWGMEAVTLNEENLLAALESASDGGDAELIRKHQAELQELIDRIQRRVHHLSKLQYRACVLRDEHAARPKSLRRSDAT